MSSLVVILGRWIRSGCSEFRVLFWRDKRQFLLTGVLSLTPSFPTAHTNITSPLKEPRQNAMGPLEQQSRANDQPVAGVTEKRKTKVLSGDEIWAITPGSIILDDEYDLGRTHNQRIGYLEGLRGLIAIEILLYIFFRLLAPAVATAIDADGTFPAPFSAGAPAWQSGLRRSLAPLFWDSTLPSAFSLILAGRVVTMTFLERRTATTLAGAAFRRPLRLLPPLLIAMAFTSVLSAVGGFRYASQFAFETKNTLAEPPALWSSTVQYVNSAFGLFFIVDALKTDVPLAFLPPAGISWFIPVVFQQSFTIYTFSVLLPYSTLSSKLWAFAGFILVTFWLGSWAWYSLTGLVIAELALVYLPLLPKAGIPLSRKGTKHLPLWLLPAILLSVGVTLKLLWASIPSRAHDEYLAHVDVSDGTLNTSFDPNTTPYPRIDDYFVASGAIVLLEVFPAVQNLLDNVVLRHFGRLSYSLYLTAGTVCLSLGSYLYVYLKDQKKWEDESGVLAVLFFTCIPLCLLTAESVHWLIEIPGMKAARWLFDYSRKE